MASVEALNLLYWAMCAVWYWCIAMAIEMASEMASEYGEFLSMFFCATLVATGAIWSEYSPNGGVQWLLSKPWTYSIGRHDHCCTGMSARPSKWQATEVELIIFDYFD